MPKTKKRKTPITQTFQGPSTGAQSCRKTIRKFHVLLKRRSQFERDVPKDKGAREVEQINSQITTLGGLEKYQEMSVLGQNNERGGGSEKVFILWMKELHLQGRYGEKKLEFASRPYCLTPVLKEFQTTRGWRVEARQLPVLPTMDQLCLDRPSLSPPQNP